MRKDGGPAVLEASRDGALPMTWDHGRQQQRRASAVSPGGKGRRFARKPVLEPLEGRLVLSTLYTGLTTIDPVQTPGGTYTLTLTGPGVERVRRAPHGQIAVTLLGTTADSTLTVALTRPRFHATTTSLQIASIKVNSGELGSIVAPGAVLNGPVTPLSGAVNTLQFGSLGTNAQLDVGGALSSLSVPGSVNLGPGGHVNVGGITQGLSLGSVDLTGGRIAIGNDIAGTTSIGTLDIAGGRFSVGHNIAGPLDIGSVDLTNGGQFVVAHDTNGLVNVTGAATITGAGSLFSTGHNLVGGLNVGQALTLDAGGQFAVGNDLTGPVNIGGVFTISNNARFIVNRDVTGTITASGDLDLASGGALAVGRTLNALTVNGNLAVSPSGGGITVGGSLTTLTVNGAFIGQGSATNADLTVGLNLGSFNVLGGGANQGGLQTANINVEKNILALNIEHGIFYSIVTAGVSIMGGSTGTTSAAIGADGTDAVLNSQILAGVSITNLTIGGDVRSTFVANPSSAGYRTRIVAGENRDGSYSSGGLIDNFQITGSLIDSVLAASVAPYGDSGLLPSSGYGTSPTVSSLPGDSGYNTYDAPAGTITGGTVGNPVTYPNYSEVSYDNESPVQKPGQMGAYNTTVDPTIDDTILFGSINPSFASPALTPTELTSAQTVTSTSAQVGSGTTTTSTVTPSDQALPLPTKSTILGGVISTSHGINPDAADFAGIFASNTSGVFVGPLP